MSSFWPSVPLNTRRITASEYSNYIGRLYRSIFVVFVFGTACASHFLRIGKLEAFSLNLQNFSFRGTWQINGVGEILLAKASLFDHILQVHGNKSISVDLHINGQHIGHGPAISKTLLATLIECLQDRKQHSHRWASSSQQTISLYPVPQINTVATAPATTLKGTQSQRTEWAWPLQLWWRKLLELLCVILPGRSQLDSVERNELLFIANVVRSLLIILYDGNECIPYRERW